MIEPKHFDHVYSLICEGPCNPTVHALDAAIARWHSDKPQISVRHAPDLIAQTRRLVHTPHTIQHTDTAVCTTCGTERRY